MKYDVIIIGAGPAGSTAAISLAQKQYNVLLLDRHSFPRDKVCGDGIPPGSMEVLFELGLEDEFRKENFHPVRHIRFMVPNGRVIETSFQSKRNGVGFYIAPRKQFDHLLQRNAIKNGASFLQANVTSLILDSGKVIGVEASVNGSIKKYFAPIIIGADGCTSLLSRSLNKQKPTLKHRAVAIRAYSNHIDFTPNTVEFFWFKQLLPGYAWIFPIDEKFVNIGLAIRADHYRQRKLELRSLLKDVLEQSPLNGRLLEDGQLSNIATWPLNLASPSQKRIVFDGALLIGDAASFIDPFSGEGIHNALHSAQIAVETIDEGFRKNDLSLHFLQNYERRCYERFSATFHRSYYIQQTMLHAPFIINGLLRLIQISPKFWQKQISRHSVDFEFEVGSIT